MMIQNELLIVKIIPHVRKHLENGKQFCYTIREYFLILWG